MDFFQRQQVARRNTTRLTVYFILAVICIVLMTDLAVAVCLQGSFGNPAIYLGVSVGTVALILCASWFKTAMLASGGKAVAELLGGRPVAPNTTDFGERMLLNVVEEMAIASGTSVPQVYVLPDETGINAFAAGHSTGDMVVCTTRGCLDRLTRDELQGVVAHEFSHILNGDMLLNLRLMGMVFGILCLAQVGRILLRTRGRKNPLPLLGLALLVIGSGGVFFAKLIKSAISRQREFLADASAVQFTRNPDGLAGALKKIGGHGSRIDDAHAEEASHFFFANGLRSSFADMFSTHPPLGERIRALDPAWDGKYINADIVLDDSARERQLAELLGGRPTRVPISPMNAVGAAVLLSQAGTPSRKHIDYASELRAAIPQTLELATRVSMSAVALIYALLLSGDKAIRDQQLEQLRRQAEPAISSETERLFTEFAGTDARVRLPLTILSMTALRRLSPVQYSDFANNIKLIIESDRQIELFEFALQKIVLRQLEPQFAPVKRKIVQYYVLKPVLPDCEVLLSALAHAGHSEFAEIEKSFYAGAARLAAPSLVLLDSSKRTLADIDRALENLNQTAPPIKKQVLTACAETVASDGVIRQDEAELLRAIAETLDCPIPPFVNV